MLGAKIKVQAHQLLELQQHLPRFVLAQFQRRVDIQLRLEVLLADQAQVDRTGELAAAPRQGIGLGLIDFLQGRNHLSVIGAVPRTLHVGNFFAKVEQLCCTYWRA